SATARPAIRKAPLERRSSVRASRPISRATLIPSSPNGFVCSVSFRFGRCDLLEPVCREGPRSPTKGNGRHSADSTEKSPCSSVAFPDGLSAEDYFYAISDRGLRVSGRLHEGKDGPVRLIGPQLSARDEMDDD